MFLTKTDLYTAIIEDELEEITRGDDSIINAALVSAEAEAKTYLYDTYDTETIFNQSGTSRHALLVNILSDIAIYLIVARVQAGQNIEDREARYKRAVATLKQYQNHESYSDLPRRTEQMQTVFSFGSKPKRNNYY